MKINAVLLSLMLFTIAYVSHSQEHRNALLIANDIYETPEKEQKKQKFRKQNVKGYMLSCPNLETPISEARELRTVLQQLGFTVTLLENADENQILEAITDFQSTTKKEKGIALFHYGGHGLQHDGTNYLIPAKNDVILSTHVKQKCISLDTITENMCADSNIIILDACRSIPFESTKTRGGETGKTRGLVCVGDFKHDKSSEFIIAYATAPEYEATDGVYTPVFTQCIREKNQTIESVLKNVKKEVREKTDNKQQPEFLDKLEQDIYLAGRDSSSLSITDTTSELELSAISPCSILINGEEVCYLSAFETKKLTVSTGHLKITAKYDDSHTESYDRVVKTSEKENIKFEYAMSEQSDICYKTAENYYYGKNGYEKNYEKAFGYYKIAANVGNSNAQNMIGLCYEKGNGAAKNETEALGWYKKAAGNGNAVAMRNIGIFYEFGKRVSVDYESAKTWYQKSIGSGYNKAKSDLERIENKIAEVRENIRIQQELQSKKEAEEQEKARLKQEEQKKKADKQSLSKLNFLGIRTAYACSKFNVPGLTSFSGNGVDVALIWIDLKDCIFDTFDFQLSTCFNHSSTDISNENLSYNELMWCTVKIGKNILGQRLSVYLGAGLGSIWESADNGQETSRVFITPSFNTEINFRLSDRWSVFGEYEYVPFDDNISKNSFKFGIMFFSISER